MAKNMFPVAVHDFYKPDGLDHSTKNDEPSLTRQEFAEECDINALMARYEGHVIGGPGGLSPPEPLYADFGALPQTLMEYMEFMKMADAEFMRLPAVVRREFDNDPRLFVDFASDPENLDQMRVWGLAPPAKAPEKAGESVSTAPPEPGTPPASGAPPASGGASAQGST